MRDAQRRHRSLAGATLYVTLEPCCTQGRTPPCTDAIIAAGIKHVLVAATDLNPAHAGRGLDLLRRAGIRVTQGLLAREAARLNEAFNHWIVQRTPFVTVKTAMTLDGKIATTSGESKWITSEHARSEAMKLRQGTDAVLVGVNTVLADDPRLTARSSRDSISNRPGAKSKERPAKFKGQGPAAAVGDAKLRRIVLDTRARTPLNAQVVMDEFAPLTTVVVGRNASARRVERLARRVAVLRAPLRHGRIDLPWLLKKLGAENVTSLLVEGGGEVNASFLLGKLARRVVFFYAPKILGGRDARKAVAGKGARRFEEILALRAVEWRQLGPDLMMTALID